jgi:tetratricopeptide (TPR) repeat protein
MSYRHLLAASLVSALTLCVSVPAFADEAAMEKAQEHFNAGAKLYFAGDYAGALVEFNNGHRLSPSAVFLYNIALAHYRLGNLDMAVNNAEKAAEVGGMPEDMATKNEARLVVWHVTKTASNWSSGEAVAESGDAGEGGSVSDGTTTEPADGGGLSGLGWAGVGTAAAGAGLLVGWSLVSGGLSDHLADIDAANAAGDEAAYNAASEAFDSDQGLAQILLYSGAGLTAVGLGLLVFDLTSGGESDQQQVQLRGGTHPTLVVRF